jgi:hypothetical protein
VDFLWVSGGGAVPVASDGAGYAAAVPVLGISVGPGVVCVGGAGVDVQYLAGPAGAVVDWVVADFGGVAVLLVLGEIREAGKT